MQQSKNKSENAAARQVQRKALRFRCSSKLRSYVWRLPLEDQKHISHRSNENLCGITEDSRFHSHGECLSGEHDGVVLDVEATHTGPAVPDLEAQEFRPTRGLATGHVHQGAPTDAEASRLWLAYPSTRAGSNAKPSTVLDMSSGWILREQPTNASSGRSGGTPVLYSYIGCSVGTYHASFPTTALTSSN